MRRKSLLDIEKYLPLPELQGESTLLSEDHIKQVSGLSAYLCLYLLGRVNIGIVFLCIGNS